ncbi:MAG TPA: tetratricopeptide repeat protein, partial [Verrucomicrobiae bacterium]|nr:tetratricopeptide repeat protein [Verrucomicrobiae bacterium]
HLLATLDELSKFYVATSNYQAAEPLMNRMIPIEKKKFGTTGKSTLSTETALANLYAKENKNAEASALFEELLPQDEQVFGPDNPVTTYTIEQLVSLDVNAGDYAKAEPFCRKQLEHAQKSGASDVEILGILDVLGTIDTKLEHNEELVSVRKQQLGILEKMSGPHSPMLLASLDKYAKALRKIKNDAEAEKVEARAASIKAARKN